MALVRERLTELGTVIFGLGLTAEKEANQTIKLWSAIVELDNYYQVVENNWFTIPQVASDHFPQEADKISKLVKEAKRMRDCSHFKKTSIAEDERTACLLCELHVQSIIVDLRARMGWLRNELRRYFLPDHRNLLVSIVWQLQATISVDDDPGASYRLVDESKDILNAISAQEELQRRAEADRLLAEAAHNASEVPPIETPSSEIDATEESKPEVCEMCKAPIGIVNDLEQCQQSLATATNEGKSLRKELVLKLKKDKKWEKAARFYDELCTLEKSSLDNYLLQGNEAEALACEKSYLTYRHEYVKTIIELGQPERNEQILSIAEATHRRREELNLGIETRTSHDQYCLLLRLLKKFEIAKAEHRRVYAEFKESAPTRALENGFKLGEIFVEEGKINPAADKFYQMYQEGKEKMDMGLASPLVLKFGLKSIEAEEARGPRCDWERIEGIYQELWGVRSQDSLSLETAALGYQYGLFLINVEKCLEAGPVLEAVRLYRITRHGIKSKEVYESTDRLLHCYVHVEDWKAAERMARAVVKYREYDSSTNADAMSAYHALGNILAAGNERRKAEIYLKKSWEGRKTLGIFDVLTLQNGCDYGNILEQPYNAITVFTDVWTHSKATLSTGTLEPRDRLTLLLYGNQLGSLLEEQKARDKYDAASKVYKEVLDHGQGSLSSESALFHAFKYGKCRYLMRDLSGAIEELRRLWEGGKEGWGEDIGNYLETGYYYFHSLKREDRKRNKIKAKKIILEVNVLARTKYGEGSEEFTRYDRALQNY